MSHAAPPRATPDASTRQVRLSYKFQRLREQLRHAIVSGDFRDKLPGERELGKRYKANAKTVNKALCDLTSEGLLVRQIGRGTFVAGGNGTCAAAGRFVCFSGPDYAQAAYRAEVLGGVARLLADQSHRLDTLASGSLDAHGRVTAADWSPAIRRSTGGALFYPSEPLSGGPGRPRDDLLCELTRRRVTSVLLGATAAGAKSHGVCPDYTDAGYRLCEHLVLCGASRVVMLSPPNTEREVEWVWNGAWIAAARHRAQLVRHVLAPDRPFDDCMDALESQNTGLLTVGGAATRAVLATAAAHGHAIEGRSSIACVLEPGDGASRECNITSYDVEPSILSAWAARLLMQSQPADRPTEVVVPGRLVPRGEVAATPILQGRLDEGDFSALEEVRI